MTAREAREKVIKGLECCHESGACGYNGNGPTCPYFKINSKAGACVQRLINDAYDLLKEQETVKTEPIEEIVNDVLLWHCRKCGFYLGPNDHFCSNCGRKVKWDET